MLPQTPPTGCANSKPHKPIAAFSGRYFSKPLGAIIVTIFAPGERVCVEAFGVNHDRESRGNPIPSNLFGHGCAFRKGKCCDVN